MFLPNLTSLYPDYEIIVVDDGSTDNTVDVCIQNKVKVVSHAMNMGNGAAIKTGARNASGDILVFMDADGQHDPKDIPRLLKKFDENYEMVVGARKSESQATIFRNIANRFYNFFASIMTGSRIDDLTSGFRLARARHFRKFIYLLPNGFSYPTTITMAFFRSGFPIAYVPIRASKRVGKSHIRLLRDGFRFLIIIVKVGALFSPMRLFIPISLLMFLTGISYYAYTYITYNRFTNMSALLFISSILTFLIGILSEQVSALHYKGMEEDQRRVKR
ncbi:MAG: glycosyl transferase [Gammaproteobacteria bacterium]|nr:MAG: glycosyl transferase [Gammaproteobacteria bacterium]